MTEPAPTQPKGGALATVMPVLVLLAVMWILEILDFLLPADFDYWGIHSRSVPGLAGIPTAPLLHGGFDHLIANTLPFLILGCLVAWRARGRFWAVAGIVVVVGGLGVWLLSPSNVVTIGASGMVFGFLGYLLALGIMTRNLVDILVSLAVLFTYGTLLWGALPFGVSAQVSWLAHLTGFLAGVLAATLLDRQRRPAAIEQR